MEQQNKEQKQQETTKIQLLQDLKNLVREKGRSNIIIKYEIQEIINKHENK